jgi:hypothetical protein
MAVFLKVAQILLLVWGAIHKVEQDLGPGNGLVKKTTAISSVIDTVAAVVSGMGVTVSNTVLQDTIGKLVDGVVALLNALGVLKPSTTPAPTPSA